VNYVTTKTRSRIESKFQRSPYTHLSGHEPRKNEEKWFALNTGVTMPMGGTLRCNSLFWAIPWGTSGTNIRVHPLKILGRSHTAPPLIEMGAKISAFDLSMLQPNLLVVGSMEGIVKVFTIPDEGIKGSNLTEAKELKLESAGKVTVCKFHPHIEDVIFITSNNYNEQVYNIEVRDLKNDVTLCIIAQKIHTDIILNIAFDYHANLIATTCKDGYARILSARDGKLVKEFQPEESLRETMAIFTSDTTVLTVGYKQGSRLCLSLWNIADECKKLKTIDIGVGNFTPLVHFDPDINILYVAKVGAASVILMEITKKTPYINRLSTYQSETGDFLGHGFLPKELLDVKKVEVAKSIKLTQKKVISPITWTVPRKRTEFFQDDLYPPIIANVSQLSVDKWFQHKGNMELKIINLKPKGMVKLSDAPPEKITERQQRYKDQLRKQKESKEIEKPKGATGHTSAKDVKDHFQNLSKNLPSRNKWDAAVDDKDEVDDDEWDD